VSVSILLGIVIVGCVVGAVGGSLLEGRGYQLCVPTDPGDPPFYVALGLSIIGGISGGIVGALIGGFIIMKKVIRPDNLQRKDYPMTQNKQDWSFSGPDDGEASSGNLIDIVWSLINHKSTRMIGRGRPHSKEVLHKLVNEAFAASLQSEEGRPVLFQVVYDDPKLSQVTSTFSDPLDYTANRLVKLAPTINVGFRWIVVAPEQPGSERLKIIGICDPEISPLALEPMRTLGGGLSGHQPIFQGMQLSVFGPGHIRVDTVRSIVELKNCSIRFPFSVSQIRCVREWYEAAAHGLDFSQLPEDSVVGEVVGWENRRRLTAAQLVRRTWGSILTKVSNARHGGTFIVVPKTADISKLVRFKYPLDCQQLRTSIQKRASFEPGLSNPGYRKSMAGSDLDDAHFSERDLARTSDLVASFAAVDGAVVLQEDLKLFGFGAEILGTEDPTENDFVKCKHPPQNPYDKPLNSFGMRHRSAYRFCQKSGGAIAFVVSQDGDLRIFCNVSDEVTLFEGSTPEDWVFSTFKLKEPDE